MSSKCNSLKVCSIFEVSFSERWALTMLPWRIIEFPHSYIVHVFHLIGIEMKTHNDLNIWLKPGNDWVLRLVTSQNWVQLIMKGCEDMDETANPTSAQGPLPWGEYTSAAFLSPCVLLRQQLPWHWVPSQRSVKLLHVSGHETVDHWCQPCHEPCAKRS